MIAIFNFAYTCSSQNLHYRLHSSDFSIEVDPDYSSLRNGKVIQSSTHTWSQPDRSSAHTVRETMYSGERIISCYSNVSWLSSSPDATRLDFFLVAIHERAGLRQQTGDPGVAEGEHQ